MTDITQKLADALRECLGHIPDDETRCGLKALSALSEFDAEAHCDRSCTWLDHAPDCKIGGSAQAHPIPAGYALVPIEPTDEMLDAAQARIDDLYRVDADRAYQAMLAAAPAAQPATAVPAGWTVLDGGGATVAEGLSWEAAADNLTPRRLARGWYAVCVADESNMRKSEHPAQENPADDAEHLRKLAEYYRAGIEQRKPKWVPSKVRLANPVRGDFPIGHTTVAHEGEYECESNRYGAISVIAENGKRLGVKPAEFEVVAWRENSPAKGAEACRYPDCKCPTDSPCLKGLPIGTANEEGAP